MVGTYVESVPWLASLSNVKDPSLVSERLEVRTDDGDDEIKDGRYDDEEGWEDQFVMVVMGDDSQEDGEEKR